MLLEVLVVFHFSLLCRLICGIGEEVEIFCLVVCSLGSCFGCPTRRGPGGPWAISALGKDLGQKQVLDGLCCTH